MLRAGWGGDCVSQCLWSPCVWSGLSHISVRISRAVTPLLKSSGVSPFDSSLSKRAGDKPPFHNVSILFLRDSSQKYFARYKESGLEQMIATNGYRSLKYRF